MFTQINKFIYIQTENKHLHLHYQQLQYILKPRGIIICHLYANGVDKIGLCAKDIKKNALSNFHFAML